MNKLVLAINFKTYPSAFGSRADEIAIGVRELSQSYNRVRIIIVAPQINASRISRIYEDTFIQHGDPLELGSNTGYTPIRAIAEEGIKGVLLNHSEHKILYKELSKAINLARDSGLEVLACADTPGEAAGIAYLQPDMIALEPPELIGTGIPVSRAKPEVITLGVNAVKKTGFNIPVLTGAGITSGDDAYKSITLGAKGILVASAVMKHERPIDKIRELAEAIEKA